MFLDLDPFYTEILPESDDESKSNEVSGLMQLFTFTVACSPGLLALTKSLLPLAALKHALLIHNTLFRYYFPFDNFM